MIAPLSNLKDVDAAICSIIIAQGHIKVFRELLHDVAQHAMEANVEDGWLRYLAIDHAMGEALDVIAHRAEALDLSKLQVLA